MTKIAPSLLSADFGRLEEEIKNVEAAGADLLHVDVMDGHFVPNITIGPFVVEAIKRYATIPLDVHLMIENPTQYIEDFINAGADYLAVHVEADNHLQRTVSRIRELKCKSGVVLNPATSLNTLDHLLDDIDLVVIMSVNPGFGGQPFIPEALKKIRKLREKLDAGGIATEIEVDGGVKPHNAGELIAAGADILVAGSAVFKSSDYADVIIKLRSGI